MFLGQNYYMLGNGKHELGLENNNLQSFYEYWQELLFERCMRLFIWENTGEVPQKEIEQRLLLQGQCAVIKKNNKLFAVTCTLFNQTDYFDEFENITYTMPYDSGTKTIGKNSVIINNCAIRNPLYPLIHHYSNLLAHVDVSLQSELVNLRSTKTAIAKTKATADTLNKWYNDLFKGKTYAVRDSYMDGVDFIDSNKNTNNLTNLMELRRELIANFYQDIGIRASYEKKERMNIPEVSLDDGVLLVNINDMLDSRKKACEEINRLFGTNWTVKKAIEYENIQNGFGDETNEGGGESED